MLAYPFEEKRLAKWKLPWLVQYKYNGHRCIAAHTPSDVSLVSSTGLPIKTVPHIEAALRDMPYGVYDGELYLHDNFQRLSSLVSPKNPVEGHKEVTYVIFDQKNEAPQDVRLLSLSLLNPPPSIIIAPSWAVSTMDELSELLSTSMDSSYEGVVLREYQATYKEKRTTTMMKIKPRSSDIYRIVGFAEEISIHQVPKGTLGAFWLVDADGELFKTGSGFNTAQRRDFWQAREQLLGLYARVKYPALTDRGVPWSSVFVEVVR